MAGHLLRIPSKLRPAPLFQQAACIHNKARIGSRDIVGYGVNGEYNYVDHIAFPMPAIRFKENTPDVVAVRDKERGDWKKLSVEDKKLLYRSSFCQTYAEMRAPDGRWKSIVGCVAFAISLSFWIYMWEKLYVYPPLPPTFSLEKRQAQLKRMIDLRVDPIDGLTSNWDYENNRWKK